MRQITLRRITLSLFVICILLFVCIYGLTRRKVLSSPVRIEAASTSELGEIISRHPIHGRVALLFSGGSGLPLADSSSDPPTPFARLMKTGTIRHLVVVVPDTRWKEIVSRQYARPAIVPPRATDSGFRLFTTGGSIDVLPLSRFYPSSGENVICIIDTGSWTAEELLRIETLLSRRLIESDLTITVSLSRYPTLP